MKPKGSISAKSVEFQRELLEVITTIDDPLHRSLSCIANEMLRKQGDDPDDNKVRNPMLGRVSHHLKRLLLDKKVTVRRELNASIYTVVKR